MHKGFPTFQYRRKSPSASQSDCLPLSAADSVDYDLFMEGTTQEGGSQPAVGRAGRKELTGQDRQGRGCGGGRDRDMWIY